MRRPSKSLHLTRRCGTCLEVRVCLSQGLVARNALGAAHNVAAQRK